jgi:amino acid transporter
MNPLLSSQPAIHDVTENEDERRLRRLGYNQEIKRIFDKFTSFGLTSSMISVLLGVIPLYTFELQSGGSAVMIWSWVIVGCFTLAIVSSMGEICSSFPTMGALYYWAFVLGGDEWGPFASWIAGNCNLLGQIAGVASGGYAGAVIFAQIISILSTYTITNTLILALYVVMLVVAGIVNTFAESLLTRLCYISVAWQILGTFVIVIWTLLAAPKLQTAAFVFTSYNNDTGFTSAWYVALVGTLAAASVFTGYDTAAHLAEETTESHTSTPYAMLYSVYNALFLGLVLIIGMNFAIQDLHSIVVRGG